MSWRRGRDYSPPSAAHPFRGRSATWSPARSLPAWRRLESNPGCPRQTDTRDTRTDVPRSGGGRATRRPRRDSNPHLHPVKSVLYPVELLVRDCGESYDSIRIMAQQQQLETGQHRQWREGHNRVVSQVRRPQLRQSGQRGEVRYRPRRQVQSPERSGWQLGRTRRSRNRPRRGRRVVKRRPATALAGRIGET